MKKIRFYQFAIFLVALSTFTQANVPNKVFQQEKPKAVSVIETNMSPDDDDIDDTGWDYLDEELTKEVSLSISDKLWLGFQFLRWKTQQLGSEVKHHINKNKEFYSTLLNGFAISVLSLGGYYYLSPDEVEAAVQKSKVQEQLSFHQESAVDQKSTALPDESEKTSLDLESEAEKSEEKKED